MALIKSTAIPPSGATGYEIDQSLKFAGGNLSRTPSSAGNRRKWSWSGWVKRAELGTYQTIWAAKTNTASIFWSPGDILRFEQYNGAGGYNFRRNFNPTMRDPSAWYHMLFIYDSAQGTETDRTQFYLNGVRQTIDYTYDAMPQNFESEWNNTEEHYIGNLGSWNYEGYVAEVHFIDGLVKAPSDFAETGDYGEWKPIDYEGTYGTNGFHLNFTGGGVMSATGGNTITTDGDYKVHTFTSNGTFTPTITGVNKSDVEYLVIAGGGGGGKKGGGGGAGGYRTGDLSVTSGTGYSITVGNGGAGSSSLTARGVDGSDSVFSSITSTGGGGGGSDSGVYKNGSDGGSGGGVAGGGYGDTVSGGDGNTPSTTPSQGNNGGNHITSSPYNGGGGGGAGAVGATNGAGGAGTASSITGASVTRAGGGGGGGDVSGSAGAGGAGGGGAGAGSSDSSVAGTANTGGGGGAGGNAGDGSSGGSGIVIIRYKFN